ncbi:hypothetical protein C0993_002472, partial [Termitomyces sp. T159_Od127]
TPCWDGCEDCAEAGLHARVRDDNLVGDVRAQIAEQLLDEAQPFPGNHIANIQLHRFRILPMADERMLVLHDLSTQQEEYFEETLIDNPKAQLAQWFLKCRAERCGRAKKDIKERFSDVYLGDFVVKWVTEELAWGAPYSSDYIRHTTDSACFGMYRSISDPGMLVTKDHHQTMGSGPHQEHLDATLLSDSLFDMQKWYAQRLYEEDAWLHASPEFEGSFEDWKKSVEPSHRLREVLGPKRLCELNAIKIESESDTDNSLDDTSDANSDWDDNSDNALGTAGLVESTLGKATLSLAGVQVARCMYTGIQWNAAVPRDFMRIVPKLVVIVVQVNGQPARALVDTGSLGNFMSSMLSNQLKVQKIELEWPLALHLAVQGSRSRINFGTRVNLKYQAIDEEHYLDIANMLGYDVILGTPWLFQHGVLVGFNPAQVVVQHNISKPMKGDDVSRIAAQAVEVYDKQLT